MIQMEKAVMWIVFLFIIIKVVFYIGMSALAYFWMYYNDEKNIKISSKTKTEEIGTIKQIGGESCLKKTLSKALTGATKYMSVKISTIPSHSLRKLYYKKIFRVKMKKNVVIYKGTVFRHGYNILIDEGSIIGDDNILDGRGGLSIGKNCNFSSGVHIWTAQHDVNGKKFEYVSKSVSIGDRCWISSDSTILPGITIGDGAVIASGSVVTKDVEPYSIYAGIPAKKIGNRNSDIEYIFSGEHDWFY